jgi:hypothetical protein
MTLDPLQGSSDLTVEPAALDAGSMSAEKPLHFGRRSISGNVGPYDGSVIRRRHSSWLKNGPERRWPSPSIAYQPDLTPRISDLFSLM